MRIDILSCVPALLTSPLSHSILQRAQDAGRVAIGVHDLRDFATDKHRQVDDYPFGGAAGMILKADVLARAVRSLRAQHAYDEIIYLTPDGETLAQPLVNRLSLCQNLLLIAGHYKGIDQRARDLFVTMEISIGDYVLSGGELPALVLTDALARLAPGVLSDETSALCDSFQDGLLEAPIYTRPADFEGHAVPDVLRGGNHRDIAAWQDAQAVAKTRRRRPDLYQKWAGEG